MMPREIIPVVDDVTIALDTTPPTIPTKVTVQQVSANSVNVTWASSTDSALGVAGYKIFRNGMQVATAAGSPFADTGLSTGNVYYYAVAAYDAAGNASSLSAQSPSVTIQPVNDGPQTIFAPVVNLNGTSSVMVSWSSATDPLAVDDYAVYRDGCRLRQ